MALPLSWQIINIAGWVAMRITEIFEKSASCRKA